MISQVIRLARRPLGIPALEDFSLEISEVPVLGQGEVLLKALYISVDPYLRGKMSGTKHPRFELGDVIASKVLAEVVASRHAGFAVGDYVSHYLPWKEWIVSDGSGLVRLPVDGFSL